MVVCVHVCVWLCVCVVCVTHEDKSIQGSRAMAEKEVSP